jgi:tetratricopeptide (TPR) repeat protein
MSTRPEAALAAQAPRRERAALYGTALVLAVALAAFGISLRNDFTFDDIAALRDNPNYAAGRIWPSLVSADYFRTSGEVTYRPVVTASYAVDHALWTRPLPVDREGMTREQHRAFALDNLRSWGTGLHLTNVLLHGLNSLLVFVLTLRLRGLPAAVAAGLLFAVHPVQAEAVNAAGYREDLLAATFVLAGSVAYLTWRSPWRVAAAAGCYLMGLLSKESAALMPAGLLLFERLVTDRDRPLRRLLPAYLVFGVVAAGYLALRFGPLYNPVETRTPYPGGSLGSGLLTALPTLVRYAGTLVFPVGLSIDYDIAPCRSAADWRVWGAAMLLAGGAWGAVRLGRRRPVAAAGVGWCIVMLLPTCNILPIPNIMADRYLYLPLAGLAVAAGDVLAAGWSSAPATWRPRLAAAFGIVVVVLGALSVDRSLDWRDPEALSAATLRVFPASPRAWLNLGNAYLERGEPEAAEPCYRRLLGSRSSAAPAYAQLAQSMEMRGRSEEAAAYYRAAHEIDPHNAVALQGLGMLALRAGRAEEAVDFFRRASEQQMRDGPTLADLGAALTLAGRRVEAEAALREALARSPRSAHVHAAWGNYLFRCDRFDEAARAHRAANDLEPGNPNTLMNLGAALTASGRYAEALPCLQRALAAAPELTPARYNLALCLAMMGRKAESEREIAELARRDAPLAKALRDLLTDAQ